MSIAGIFLLLAFLGGVLTIIVWPLLYSAKPAPEAVPSLRNVMPAVAELRTQHEAILTAIRDLDFDWQTGKLAEADYRAQREVLVQQGVELLKAIDSQESDLIEDAVRSRRVGAQRPEKSNR